MTESYTAIGIGSSAMGDHTKPPNPEVVIGKWINYLRLIATRWPRKLGPPRLESRVPYRYYKIKHLAFSAFVQFDTHCYQFVMNGGVAALQSSNLIGFFSTELQT